MKNIYNKISSTSLLLIILILVLIILICKRKQKSTFETGMLMPKPLILKSQSGENPGNFGKMNYALGFDHHACEQAKKDKINPLNC